jgi:hypothetical protein
MSKMTYDLPEGVELEILDDDAYRTDRQDSAFYTWGDTNKVAIVSYGEREFSIYCVGEMRIHYKDQVIRYCDDLVNAGITNDSDLSKIDDEGGEWVNNSWFEIYDELAQEYTMEVYHEVKDAIETVAIQIIGEEEVNV